MLQSNHEPLCPLPGFVEIAQTLQKEEPMESDLLPVIASILSEETIDPYKGMGTALMVTWLLQHHTTTEVLINI